MLAMPSSGSTALNAPACCSRLAAKQEEAADSRSASPGSVSLQQKGLDPRTPPTPDVRLYHRAVVVAQVPLATQTCVVSSDMP